MSVHTRGRFQVRSIFPGSLLPNIQLVKYRGAFWGLEILLPRMKYTHEIVGIHGGAFLPERARKACSRSKTPRVYRPLASARKKDLISMYRGARMYRLISMYRGECVSSMYRDKYVSWTTIANISYFKCIVIYCCLRESKLGNSTLKNKRLSFVNKTISAKINEL